MEFADAVEKSVLSVGFNPFKIQIFSLLKTKFLGREEHTFEWKGVCFYLGTMSPPPKQTSS